MIDLAGAPLADVIAALRGGARTIAVADPDRGAGRYPGESLADGAVHRPWSVWVELADRLELRLLTPRVRGDGRVELTFAPRAAPTTFADGYGADSAFARVRKLEDPGFAIDLDEALDRCALPARARVLELGSNRGDVVGHLAARAPDAELVGVDLDASAIAVAAARGLPNARFVAADAATYTDAARFDLVLAIGLLQSGALDDRALLRRIVQDLLTPTGAVILGVPNCRYADGDLTYGARMKNFRQPELGLLVKDVAFFRKYLQQHHRKVYVTGRNYVFVTAVHARAA